MPWALKTVHQEPGSPHLEANKVAPLDPVADQRHTKTNSALRSFGAHPSGPVKETPLQSKDHQIPAADLFYGLLGLIPFLAPAPLHFIAPGLDHLLPFALAAYSAIILSFIGGARFGLTNGHARPSAAEISFSMLPSLVGWALLLLPETQRVWQLAGLAAALLIHGIWDICSTGTPPWYPRLRAILTLGAVIGLGADIAVMTSAPPPLFRL
jgi:hypothetical protein